jgi:hypothetical protein
MVWRTATGLWLLTAVWLLGNVGFATDQAPIPKREESPKRQTLPEQALSLWQRDIDQYRLHTKDPQSLRPQAEEFMRAVQLNMLPHPRGPRLEKTAEMGKRLFEQGCQDPLVKTYYGKAISRDKGAFYALAVLNEALNAWPQSEYLDECRRVGVFTVFGEAKRYAYLLAWPHFRDEAAMLAALRVGDESIGPEMRRVVLHELLPLIDDECGPNWEDSVAISDACSKQPKADPWILHMLAGRAFIGRAWHHRGGKWAYKVTPEGWNLFGENLRKAAHEFSEAIKLHPENPEAASFMITVAMGGESDRTPQEWFDKAVAAEIDYMPSYKKLRWALLPRWGGSHEEMYRFGCRCADTQRYDTDVPFFLVEVVNNIEKELSYNGKFWRREGVYTRVKEVLEGMAQDPSRANDSSAFAGRLCIKTIHAILAARAGEYADARRLVDELGDRLDRKTFDRWCTHPGWELTRIYAFSGRGAHDMDKAWAMLIAAPKPIPDQVLQEAKDLYQKALTADGNERSKAFCRCWINEVEGRLAFGAGKWYEKKFDPKLLAWAVPGTTWSMENESTVIGHPRWANARVFIRTSCVPVLPLEVEFDVETPNPPPYPTDLGLFIPEAGKAYPAQKTFHRFFVRTRDNLAGIEIGGKIETVPCKLKPVNRIRVQLANDRAVLYVNETLCLDRSEKEFRPLPVFNFGCHTYSYPDMLVRISNVRIRRWELPKEEPAVSETTQETGMSTEATLSSEKGDMKKK